MKKENLFCHRCGCELETIDEEYINEDSRGVYYRFMCPNCGIVYEVDEPCEEEKKKYDFWEDEDISNRVSDEGNHIMNDICINCGNKVYVGNNFMLSDCTGEDLPEDDDKMNYCINQCSNCGCSEIRWDNSENEKENLEYWKPDILLKETLKDYDFFSMISIYAKTNEIPDNQMHEFLDKAIKYYTS